MIPVYKLPLCKCANTSASCLGRKEGVACMAHDKWYEAPCDKGECPGLGHSLCCHKGPSNRHYESTEEE